MQSGQAQEKSAVANIKKNIAAAFFCPDPEVNMNNKVHSFPSAEEEEFAYLHQNDTDQALLTYVRAVAEQLGEIPKVKDVVGYYFIKKRLGPWPRVLEKAGLKQKSKRREEKEKKKQTLLKNQLRYRKKREERKNTKHLMKGIAKNELES